MVAPWFRRLCVPTLLTLVCGLSACTTAGNGSSAASAGPVGPSKADGSVAITLVCRNSAYCGQTGAGTCAVSDISTQYPSTKLTVSGTDGAVLATQPLPVSGVVTGSTSTGYTCTASLTIPVPKRNQYQVDAFGFRSATGLGPFNFSIP